MTSRIFKRSHLLTCLVALSVSASAGAAEWGNLKGKFVYSKGMVQPEKLNVNKDVEYCKQHDVVNEQVMTGEGGALQNVFVYLYTRRGQSVDVHPDLQKVSEEPVVLNNKGCRFEPHALLVQTSRPFEIRNSDEGIGHNTNAQTLVSNPKFNEQVSSATPISKVFEKPEAYPAEIACNVHPWMKGFLLIRDNPYMVVAGKDGTFEIKNIPAGEHDFIFWHEAKGNIRDLPVGDGKTSRRGRAKLEIPAGETLDLGEIKVTPVLLGL